MIRRFFSIAIITLALSFTSHAQIDSTRPDPPPPPMAQDEADPNKVFDRVEVEASFPGGLAAWRHYLEENLRANTPVDKGAPAGSYTVIVQFIVDREGNISNITTLTNHGYGLEQEVVRVIKAGPKWLPAVQNGRTVNAYRRQPVTFVVMEEDDKKKKKNKHKDS